MADNLEKSVTIQSEISVKEMFGFVARANERGADRARQKQILANLPSNLLDDLYAGLRASYIADTQFSADGVPRGEFDMRKHLTGEVFEALVENDPVLNPTRGLNQELAAVSAELLSLAHNPDRFGMKDELGHIRNPDLTRVELTDDGKLHIKTVGEAKLGLLNARDMRQLGESGFRQSLHFLVEKLNGKEDLESLGLTELNGFLERTRATNPSGDFIVVDEGVRQELYVPSDRKVDNPAKLINRSDFRHADREEAVNILKNDVTIKAAAFSVSEVSALSDYLMGKIMERYGE